MTVCSSVSTPDRLLTNLLETLAALWRTHVHMTTTQQLISQDQQLCGQYYVMIALGLINVFQAAIFPINVAIVSLWLMLTLLPPLGDKDEMTVLPVVVQPHYEYLQLM